MFDRMSALEDELVGLRAQLERFSLRVSELAVVSLCRREWRGLLDVFLLNACLFRWVAVLYVIAGEGTVGAIVGGR